MITVTILTRNNLKIIYKGVDHYRFEGDKIKIVIHDDSKPDSLIIKQSTDCYSFSDLKGIIIKKKGTKNAG